MTNFSGIGSYQLNSVNFKESTNYGGVRGGCFQLALIPLKLFQNDLININEKFLVTTAQTSSGLVAYDVRVVLSENQLEFYADGYYPEIGINTHTFIRFLCKFDEHLNVKNIIIDGSQDSSIYMTCYFANSKIYEKNSLSETLENKIRGTFYSSFGYIGTKNATPTDITSIMDEIVQEYNALPAI